MTEPDVALTDYALALLCAAFAWLLHRRGSGASALRGPLVLFFASISATTLAGGTVHGFFLDEASIGNALLWPATLLGVGVTALSAWIIGARIQFAPPAARWIEAAALLGFVIYAATVLFVSTSFRVAVMNYLPAVLFLMAVYGLRLGRGAGRPIAWGLGGLVMTLLAAGLQQAKIGLHASYFNHNALYHLLQGAGLWLFYVSARGLLAPDAGAGGIRRQV